MRWISCGHLLVADLELLLPRHRVQQDLALAATAPRPDGSAPRARLRSVVGDRPPARPPPRSPAPASTATSRSGRSNGLRRISSSVIAASSSRCDPHPLLPLEVQAHARAQLLERLAAGTPLERSYRPVRAASSPGFSGPRPGSATVLPASSGGRVVGRVVDRRRCAPARPRPRAARSRGRAAARAPPARCAGSSRRVPGQPAAVGVEPDRVEQHDVAALGRAGRGPRTRPSPRAAAASTRVHRRVVDRRASGGCTGEPLVVLRLDLGPDVDHRLEASAAGRA